MPSYTIYGDMIGDDKKIGLFLSTGLFETTIVRIDHPLSDIENPPAVGEKVNKIEINSRDYDGDNTLIMNGPINLRDKTIINFINNIQGDQEKSLTIHTQDKRYYRQGAMKYKRKTRRTRRTRRTRGTRGTRRTRRTRRKYIRRKKNNNYR